MLNFCFLICLQKKLLQETRSNWYSKKWIVNWFISHLHPNFICSQIFIGRSIAFSRFINLLLNYIFNMWLGYFFFQRYLVPLKNLWASIFNREIFIVLEFRSVISCHPHRKFSILPSHIRLELIMRWICELNSLETPYDSPMDISMEDQLFEVFSPFSHNCLEYQHLGSLLRKKHLWAFKPFKFDQYLNVHVNGHSWQSSVLGKSRRTTSP